VEKVSKQINGTSNIPESHPHKSIQLVFDRRTKTVNRERSVLNLYTKINLDTDLTLATKTNKGAMNGGAHM
jgi:hypothetical protein